MALGSSRWRLVIIVIVILLLWQSSRVWYIFTQTDPAPQAQFQVNQAVTQAEPKDETQKVEVVVYYEALCPDSRSFFIKQLVPTYNKIPKNLQVRLVPYGKATTIKEDHDYKFSCQHGPIECQANIIHACSIDAISDMQTQLTYLACMIKNNIDPLNAMETCANKLNIEYGSIMSCAESAKGRELLAIYGKMTNTLTPHVSFIPTVTLDGSSRDQASVLKNLLQQVCVRLKVIPNECIL